MNNPGYTGVKGLEMFNDVGTIDYDQRNGGIAAAAERDGLNIHGANESECSKLADRRGRQLASYLRVEPVQSGYNRTARCRRAGYPPEETGLGADSQSSTSAKQKKIKPGNENELEIHRFSTLTARPARLTRRRCPTASDPDNFRFQCSSKPTTLQAQTLYPGQKNI